MKLLGAVTYVCPDVLLLEQLDKLINQHFRERKDPAFYASQLAYSERWLSNLCRFYRDKTVFGLIQDRLVRESKLLLCCSRLSAKVIAYDLGFEDPAYFCRFFKKMTGTTTKAYRRSYRMLMMKTGQKNWKITDTDIALNHFVGNE